MSELVWYASYGSNLLRERFLTYLQGGKVPGSTSHQVGCTDPTPPREDRGILILHQLFFAESSSRWGGGGVAFLNPQKEEEAKTLGRMYLITAHQFTEVFLQENGYQDMTDDPGVDLEKTVREGRTEIPDHLYGTILHLGEEDGHPIFTFTGSWEDGEEPLNPPGAPYLNVIARGLRETFSLSAQGIQEYFHMAPGIQGFLSREALADILPRI